jgi:uncharacterized protein YprB with RNaseH-like and TPR domain
MQIAVFDIETTGLDAIGSGALLLAVIKPVNRGSTTLRADEVGCKPGNEKKLVAAVIAALEPFDILIGHNIFKFDIPWLNSRAVFFDLPQRVKPFAVYDTMRAFGRLNWKTVLNSYGKPTKALGHVIDFFGIEQEKTAIYPRAHWEAVWNNRGERIKTMDEIAAHCYADVRMTEKIYWQLLKAERAARATRNL